MPLHLRGVKRAMCDFKLLLQQYLAPIVYLLEPVVLEEAHSTGAGYGVLCTRGCDEGLKAFGPTTGWHSGLLRLGYL